MCSGQLTISADGYVFERPPSARPLLFTGFRLPLHTRAAGKKQTKRTGGQKCLNLFIEVFMLIYRYERTNPPAEIYPLRSIRRDRQATTTTILWPTLANTRAALQGISSAACRETLIDCHRVYSLAHLFVNTNVSIAIAACSPASNIHTCIKRTGPNNLTDVFVPALSSWRHY